MTLFDRRKEKLIAELKNKEYRDAFVSEHISTGIPFQIKILREQRKWSQKELGKRTGKHQEIISQLEDPNYGSFTISTLKRLASAFDIGLVVRFVPISELVKWELNLSSEALRVPSFEDDSFEVKEIPDSETYDSKGYMFQPWTASANVIPIRPYQERKEQLLETQSLSTAASAVKISATKNNVA